MKIGIIGCGNMGRALIKGITARRLLKSSRILASDRDKKRLNSARVKFGVSIAGSNSLVFKQCGLVILAVKLQDLEAALKDLPLPLKGKTLISICAGVTTKRLERLLGKVAVVRVMPNMPAKVGQGISAICLGRYARAEDKRLAKSIFSCVGEVVEVKERLMDAVTAISGSGPAYFFYLIEQLIAAARQLGISQDVARKLAIKTALGSSLLISQSKDAPASLIKAVSSKGGTTEAALKIFTKKGLDKILRAAVRAAAQRSKQLEAAR